MGCLGEQPGDVPDPVVVGKANGHHIVTLDDTGRMLIIVPSEHIEQFNITVSTQNNKTVRSACGTWKQSERQTCHSKSFGNR